MYLYTQMEIVTKYLNAVNWKMKFCVMIDPTQSLQHHVTKHFSISIIKSENVFDQMHPTGQAPLVCPSSVLKYENLATHNCLIIVELKKYWVFLVIWVRSFNMPNAKLYLPRINILWVLYIFLKPSTVHQLYLKGNTLNFVSKEQTWNMTQPHCINFFRKHFCWLSIKIFVGPRCYVFQ